MEIQSTRRRGLPVRRRGSWAVRCPPRSR